MDLKKYNYLLTYMRRSTKDPKDKKILALVRVAQKRLEDAKKSSEKSDKSNKKSNSSTNG